MDEPRFLVRDDPTIAPGARRFLFQCRHGSTTGVAYPGRKPLADAIVLDLLRVRHEREKGCRCSTLLRPTVPVARG